MKKIHLLTRVSFVLFLLAISSLALAEMRKGPYLILTENNIEMMVLWQIKNTTTCSLEWGKSTSYSSGSVYSTEINSGTDGHQHIKTITGLIPGQKYYYRITENSTSHTGSFIAAPATNATNFSFYSYGDSQDYPDRFDQTSEALNNVLEDNPTSQGFILFNGDWTDENSESDWDFNFFNRSYSNTLEVQSKLPFMGCKGNHELYEHGPYNKYYPYPQYVGGGCSDIYDGSCYYSFTYGSALIISLDMYTDFEEGTDQYKWLEQQLSGTNKTWKIVTFHEPAWGDGGHDNNTEVQDELHPLFKKYGVQVCFSGHNHNYTRAVVDGIYYLVLSGCSRGYVADGSAISPYDGSSTQPYIEYVDKYNHFGKFDISGNVMTAKIIRNDGSTIETFTITTSGGGSDAEAPSAPSNLSSSNITQTGVSLNWNASTDNVGVTAYDIYRGSTNSGSTANTSYIVAGLNANTSYNFTVRAKDAAGNVSSASNQITITTFDDGGSGCSYCATKGASQKYEWITEVQIGNFSKTTVAESGGYGNYISEIISLSSGSSVNAILTPNTDQYAEYFKVWIDFNKDCDFDDSGEEVLSGSAKGSTIGIISIPSNANGTTRLRVSLRYNSAPSSCGDIDYGEVEDYTVSFTGGGSDTESPSAPSGLSSSNITQTGVSLSWTASTDNVGVSSYDIFNGSTNMGNSASNNYSVTGLSANTTYTFTVKAKDTAGNISESSNAITITTENGGTTPTYCSASGKQGPEYISKVRLGSIDNSSSRDSYKDYTSQSASVSKGNSYTLFVTIGDPYNDDNEATAWFDWNIDGDFDDSGEEYILNANSDSDRSISISVPSGATSGTTRMRVRVSYYDAKAIPCDESDYGEVEDYSIDIGSSKLGVPIAKQSKNFTLFPNPVKDELNVELLVVTPKTKLIISNMSGIILKRLTINSNITSIDLSDIEAGIYIVSINGESEILSIIN